MLKIGFLYSSHNVFNKKMKEKNQSLNEYTDFLAYCYVNMFLIHFYLIEFLPICRYKM